MKSRFFLFALFALALVSPSLQKQNKDCEVCNDLLSAAFDGGVNGKSLEALEGSLESFCNDLSGVEKSKVSAFKKLCYFLTPMKRSVSQPLKNGLPFQKVCERLKKSSSEVCAITYPVKVDVGNTDYTKMRIKQLKKILRDRGTECNNCLEKDEFVKLAQETEHLEL